MQKGFRPHKVLICGLGALFWHYTLHEKRGTKFERFYSCNNSSPVAYSIFVHRLLQVAPVSIINKNL
jgi:hypothetical protein